MPPVGKHAMYDSMAECRKYPESSIHKILFDNVNYDKMIFSVGKGVILCQVTQSGIQLNTKRRQQIPNVGEYLRV
jgi:hypothetical protein